MVGRLTKSTYKELVWPSVVRRYRSNILGMVITFDYDESTLLLFYTSKAL
jgi:hypothetical protein